MRVDDSDGYGQHLARRPEQAPPETEKEPETVTAMEAGSESPCLQRREQSNTTVD